MNESNVGTKREGKAEPREEQIETKEERRIRSYFVRLVTFFFFETSLADLGLFGVCL